MHRNFEQICRIARTKACPAERSAFIAEACGVDVALRERVEAVLAQADPQGTAASEALGKDQATRELEVDKAPSRETAGQYIDRYRLLQPLGEGGFGSVWMAEQREPVRRRVAVKIIKLGMDTRQVIARFEAERQALAMMDHPAIAQVLDAGSTESGRPYFAMELVKGAPITDFCNRARLPLRARLELFVDVCLAIQHAHQKGIIHRDIKPANVLVTEQDGRALPKVIDFGIAKAMHGGLTQMTLFTEHRQVIGTPAYMSPEQAELSSADVDTRSDVYALGVVLYELLTGSTPFGARELGGKDFIEIARVIREVEPELPSSRIGALDAGLRTSGGSGANGRSGIADQLRGELDWIVMKCLDKDRERRYQTVGELVDDIRRHLRSEPVLAAPPSAGYRLRKFVRRHRGRVIAASAVLLVLVLGLVGTGLGMAWALREKARAEFSEREATRLLGQAQEVKRLMSDMLVSVRPEVARGLDPTLMLQTLAATRERLDREAPSDPLIEAELRQVMGSAYRHVAAYEDAERELRLAWEIRRRHQGQRHPETLESLASLASQIADSGRLEAGEAMQRQVWEGRRTHFGDVHPHTLASLMALASTLHGRGRLVDAERYYAKAVGDVEAIRDREPDLHLSALAGMAAVLRSQGRYSEAEPFVRQVLEWRRETLGEDHRDTLAAMTSLGGLLRYQRRFEETEPLYMEAMQGFRRLLGDAHPTTLNAINGVAGFLQEQGRLEEAEPYFREAAEGRRAVLGESHPATLRSQGNLGSLLGERGRLDEARLLVEAALQGQRRALGPDHTDTLNSLGALGLILLDAGELAQARDLLIDAMQRRERSVGPDHPNTLVSMQHLSEALLALGDFADAESLAADATRRAEHIGENGHGELAMHRLQHARILAAQERWTEAVEQGRDAYASLRSRFGEADPRVTAAAASLDDLLQKRAPHARGAAIPSPHLLRLRYRPQ
jgi:eukaryotic-like serine/threonine-protein kinase